MHMLTHRGPALTEFSASAAGPALVVDIPHETNITGERLTWQFAVIC